MHYISAFLNIIWRIWFALIASVYILIIGILIVLPLSFSNKTFPIAYKFIQFWGTYMFYGMGFRKEYIQKEQLDKNESYIFVANHTSIMDIILMLHILKNHPIIFVGKAELLKIPIFGRIYNRVAIPVDRSSLKSRANVYPEAKKRISGGLNLFIFPEGGVADDTSIVLDNFKEGAFAIAMETQTPLAVLSICGFKKMYPFSYTKGFPGKVRVTLQKIITADKYETMTKTELKDLCWQIIYTDLENCSDNKG